MRKGPTFAFNGYSAVLGPRPRIPVGERIRWVGRSPNGPLLCQVDPALSPRRATGTSPLSDARRRVVAGAHQRGAAGHRLGGLSEHPRPSGGTDRCRPHDRDRAVGHRPRVWPPTPRTGSCTCRCPTPPLTARTSTPRWKNAPPPMDTCSPRLRRRVR